MQSGPDKDYKYDEFIENTYQIDDDEIDLFKNHRNAIQHFAGYNLKALIVKIFEIDCSDQLQFDTNNDSFIIMLPICQLFADQYYSCEKFQQTVSEFNVFLLDVTHALSENVTDQKIVKNIQSEIKPYLEDGETFVCFCLK